MWDKRKTCTSGSPLIAVHCITELRAEETKAAAWMSHEVGENELQFVKNKNNKYFKMARSFVQEDLPVQIHIHEVPIHSGLFIGQIYLYLS